MSRLVALVRYGCTILFAIPILHWMIFSVPHPTIHNGMFIFEWSFWVVTSFCRVHKCYAQKCYTCEVDVFWRVTDSVGDHRHRAIGARLYAVSGTVGNRSINPIFEILKYYFQIRKEMIIGKSTFQKLSEIFGFN